MAVINTNYSITQLFLSHTIDIHTEEGDFQIHLPSLRELYTIKSWAFCYNLWTKGLKFLNVKDNQNLEDLTAYKLMQLILFDLGRFDKFRPIYDFLIECLNNLFIDFNLDAANKTFYASDINITEEIWDYVQTLVQLSYGEKTSLPPVFHSEEARQLYLAQKKNEDKIRQLRAKGANEEGLLKMFLSIIYAFPSFTFDWLWDQTLAQIQWLQKYAAGAVSYEVNAQAFAAGNVKKGKKLDFFIK